MITFESFDIFTFAHRVYLQGVRVKFVGLYEGHRVKVKVTGAKSWTTIQSSRKGNLRARPAQIRIAGV